MENQHLVDFLGNQRQVLEGWKEELDKAIKEEDFFKAQGFKMGIYVHEMYIYRLERILDGLPAFEEPINLINDTSGG